MNPIRALTWSGILLTVLRAVFTDLTCKQNARTAMKMICLATHTNGYRIGSGKIKTDIRLTSFVRRRRKPMFPLGQCISSHNPSLTCALAHDDYLGPTVEGINLADGYQIRSLATSGLRRIPTIRQHLHSLTLLFCTTDNRIPTPADVRQYLLQHVSNYLGFPAGVRDRLVEDGDTRIPPEVGTSIPHDVFTRLEAEATDDAPRPLPRWRLIFLSDDVRASAP